MGFSPSLFMHFALIRAMEHFKFFGIAVYTASPFSWGILDVAHHSGKPFSTDMRQIRTIAQIIFIVLTLSSPPTIGNTAIK